MQIAVADCWEVPPSLQQEHFKRLPAVRTETFLLRGESAFKAVLCSFGRLARPWLDVSQGKPSCWLVLGEGRRHRLSPAGRVGLESTKMSAEPHKQGSQPGF